MKSGEDAVHTATPRAATSATEAAHVAPDVSVGPPLSSLERVTHGAPGDARLPIVVAIHGLGDRPESYLTWADALPQPVRLVAPRAPRAYGDGYSWMTYPLLPDEGQTREILEATASLTRWVRDVVRTRPHDGRLLVTGFSQGGYLSYALAVLHPELVTAAFPMSGGFPPPLLAVVHAPDGHAPRIFGVHGADDDRVPLGPTRDAVARLRALGFDAELRVYPDVMHAVSAEMRRDLMAQMAAALAR
jgi:phospholipase/carboxylesterase